MIDVQNLHFRYQFRSILRDLSFQVKTREVLHIVGPNGCGKSTLMSILAGLRKENKGQIRYLHADGKEASDRREAIEYLPAEANALFAKSDAASNLKFWARMRGHDPSMAAISAALKHWELDHPLLRQHFPVERFSTGMRRRLAMARLELAQVPCWLLDEPLYGLDAKGILSFQNLLASHIDQGGLALIVSHDVAPLAGLTTQTLHLNQEGLT